MFSVRNLVIFGNKWHFKSKIGPTGFCCFSLTVDLHTNNMKHADSSLLKQFVMKTASFKLLYIYRFMCFLDYMASKVNMHTNQEN